LSSNGPNGRGHNQGIGGLRPARPCWTEVGALPRSDVHHSRGVRADLQGSSAQTLERLMTVVAAWKCGTPRQALAPNTMALEAEDSVMPRRHDHASNPKPRARLALFGSVSLQIGDREIPLFSRKACALVAYLALNPAMRESRDRLAGLLWSESEDAKARSS